MGQSISSTTGRPVQAQPTQTIELYTRVLITQLKVVHQRTPPEEEQQLLSVLAAEAHGERAGAEE